MSYTPDVSSGPRKSGFVVLQITAPATQKKVNRLGLKDNGLCEFVAAALQG
jgi:hypothetical protein